MEGKIEIIKQWLGSGSINIFGIQFAGKDSVGIPLAEMLGGVFISSGDLVRAAMHNEADKKIRQAAIDSQTGILTPTEEFRRLIMPHLKDKKLAGKPLLLGSVGRWIGEEEPVMEALIEGNHPLKAVVVLNITEDIIWQRWEKVRNSRNGGRADDIDRSRVKLRLDEFYHKTVPVIDKYRQMGLVIDVDSSGSVESSLSQTIDGLVSFISESSS